jgi:hypothetical protein
MLVCLLHTQQALMTSFLPFPSRETYHAGSKGTCQRSIYRLHCRALRGTCSRVVFCVIQDSRRSLGWYFRMFLGHSLHLRSLRRHVGMALYTTRRRRNGIWRRTLSCPHTTSSRVSLSPTLVNGPHSKWAIWAQHKGESYYNCCIVCMLTISQICISFTNCKRIGHTSVSVMHRFNYRSWRTMAASVGCTNRSGGA